MDLKKVTDALGKLIGQVSALETRVDRIQKVKPIVKEGPPGKDGKDADVETVVSAVLERVPKPKDGKSPNKDEIVADVLAKIPKPRDGRDGQTVSVSDVAAIVLAKLPKPKDGRDAPDLETIVAQVRPLVQDGEPGPQGPAGPPGKDGKDGVSVTEVKLTNNKLFVWLDGVKKLVGEIRVPTPTAPFTPGNNGGGGGGSRIADQSYLIRGGFFDYNDVATQSTPINVPGTLTDVDLTNDEQGAFTNKDFPPPGTTDLWDADNNEFDFSQLKLGDMIDIRIDLNVTTTQPNQSVIVDLLLAIGSGADYRINFIRNTYKNVTERQVISFEGIYLGDDNTNNFPAKFVIRSDSEASVKVSGWYVRALVRG